MDESFRIFTVFVSWVVRPQCGFSIAVCEKERSVSYGGKTPSKNLDFWQETPKNESRQISSFDTVLNALLVFFSKTYSTSSSCNTV